MTASASEQQNAIEMRALRKVYKGTGKTKRRGPPPGMSFGMPGGGPMPAGDVVALDALDLEPPQVIEPKLEAFEEVFGGVHHVA